MNETRILDELRSEPPHAYLQQSARALRFLRRYRRARLGASFEDLEDYLWAFFQNCWHIKDWLRHDPTVPEEAIQNALRLAEGHSTLNVVADLANGSKHFGRDPKRRRTDADDGAIMLNDGPDGSVITEHIVVVTRGDLAAPEEDTWTAIRLAEAAMDAWRECFDSAGLRSWAAPEDADV